MANANASDRLAGALTQLGRLMRTLHVLRYIHEAPLRDAIQLQLNCGSLKSEHAAAAFHAAKQTKLASRPQCGHQPTFTSQC